MVCSCRIARAVSQNGHLAAGRTPAERFVPLLPALDYVIFRTLAICKDFSRTIERISAYSTNRPEVCAFR